MATTGPSFTHSAGNATVPGHKKKRRPNAAKQKPANPTEYRANMKLTRTLLLAGLLALGGCSTIHPVGLANLPADLPPDDAATIIAPNFVNFTTVDGKTLPHFTVWNFCNGAFCGAGSKLYLTPGQHEVAVRFSNGVINTVEDIKLNRDFKKGVHYSIQPDIGFGKVRLHIAGGEE